MEQQHRTTRQRITFAIQMWGLAWMTAVTCLYALFAPY